VYEFPNAPTAVLLLQSCISLYNRWRHDSFCVHACISLLLLKYARPTIIYGITLRGYTAGCTLNY